MWKFGKLVDILPLVGTLKNTIEAGIAVYDGNYEKAGGKCVKAVVGGALDLVSFGVVGSLGRLAIEGAAKPTVHVLVNGAPQLIFLANASARLLSSKLEDNIRADNILHHDFPHEDNLEQDQRDRDDVPEGERQTQEEQGGGGEQDVEEQEEQQIQFIQVFNNNVLTVNADIINQFVHRHMNTTIQVLLDNGRLAPDSNTMRAYNRPFEHNISESIMEMRVNQADIPVQREDVDFQYIEYTTSIQRSVVRYMDTIFQNGQENVEPIEMPVINDLIHDDSFVRQHVQNAWLHNQLRIPNAHEPRVIQDSYNEVHESIVSMFRRIIEDARMWAEELRIAADQHQE